MSRLILLVLPVLSLLAACGGQNRGNIPEASRAEVQAAALALDGPSTLTLMTALRTISGEGTHSALILDHDQRYVFDPAGSWRHENLVERGDVLYGMGSASMRAYLDYYANDDYHLVLQDVPVSAAQADRLARLITTAGRQSPATCSRSITRILQATPGFEAMPTTWFPARTMRNFAALPGVESVAFYDDDPADNIEAAEARAAISADLAADHLD